MSLTNFSISSSDLDWITNCLVKTSIFFVVSITRSEFLEDIARVDLLKDVFDVRLRVLGNVDAATKKSEKKVFNLATLTEKLKQDQ